MRKVRITPIYVYRCRRDNYVHHIDCRRLVQAENEEILQNYQRLCEFFVPTPILNAFGCDSYTDDELGQIIRIANSEKVKAGCLNPWYLSESGWSDFQSQWDQLPEASPELCRQLEVEQNRKADAMLFESHRVDLAPTDQIKHMRYTFNKMRWKYFYQLVKQNGERCRICGASENLTVDHIIPIARGGTNDLENLQLLCRKHNSQKSYI